MEMSTVTPFLRRDDNTSSGGSGSKMDLVWRLVTEYQKARADRDAERADVLGNAIDLLTKQDPERPAVLARLWEIDRLPARGTEVFGKLILFAQRAGAGKKVSVSDFKAAAGPEVDATAVHNAVAYMASSGRLRRVARGQYIITDLGAGLIDPDGREFGTNRLTEHDS